MLNIPLGEDHHGVLHHSHGVLPVVVECAEHSVVTVLCLSDGVLHVAVADGVHVLLVEHSAEVDCTEL